MLKCMQEDRLYCLGIVTLAVAGSMLGVFLYWLLMPLSGLTVKQPFSVLNENHQVSIGENLIFQIEYNKEKDIPTTANRYIECEDGNLVTLVAGGSTLPKGERTINAQVIVPEKASLGECVYVTEVTYKLNPLKIVTRTYKTEPFTVVE